MSRIRAHTLSAQRPRSALLACLLATAALVFGAGARAETPTRVRFETTLGSFVIEVNSQRAPLTAENFLSYVKSGHYNGTIFHRVINNFIVQAGGFDEKFQPKSINPPVVNESGNGLSNKRGTVGQARTDLPHSGNAQFYINLTDNDELDPTPLRWGYAVFGRVVEGMEVVDAISRRPTGAVGPWPKDVPLENIVIKRAEIIKDAGAPAPAAPATPPPKA
jgi:cyclophilin family peptidyl-prolyl cis-trans isomerase